MKIIAEVNSDRFIVEATSSELAQIMGFAGTYHLKDRAHQLAVGRDVQVTPLYQALEVSRERKEEIAGLAEELRKAADRVDSINNALASPIVEVKS